MKRFVFCIVGLLFMAVMVSGCASIITGTKQTIKVQCEPADSKILINGAVHQSPCTQDVERGINASSKNKVVVEKGGYRTCEFNTTGTLHPWFLGNIILGGLIGMAIDLGTGAASSVEQEEIKMVLYPDKPCDIYILARNRQEDKWMKPGEKEASPQDQKNQPPKEDPFKNVQTGQPQPAK